MSVLNVTTVVALQTIIEAAQGTRKVARLLNDGTVVEGTARAFVKSPETMSFLSSDDDVREAFLWVTLSNGFEATWPIAELIPQVTCGEFAVMS